MRPGYIHFDLSHGLKACMLNAATYSLKPDQALIADTFSALGMGELSFECSEFITFGRKCAVLKFYVDGHAIDQEIPTQAVIKKPSRPLWDSPQISPSNTPLPKDLKDHKNDFLAAIARGENILLSEIETLFHNKKLKPEIAALALKIIASLKSSSFSEQKLSSADALWMFCHLTFFCAQITALDPKFVSATRLCVGGAKRSSLADTLFLNDNMWINEILAELPHREVREDIAVDVLGLAILKTVCSHFGVRGHSTIYKTSLGTSASENHWAKNLVAALWCEADVPDTMGETGPSNSAKIAHACEISALVPCHQDTAELANTLSRHGASSISWNLVHSEKNSPYQFFRALCSSDFKHELCEALLVKSGATEISIRDVESHGLSKRLVAVPMGQGNKTFSARFYEYIYFEKTVRVEPLAEDIDSYVQKTNYSVDVARSDLLMAWKRWRKKVPEET